MTFFNKVSWAIEPDRCALLIHDMQPHYLDVLSADRRGPLVANVRAVARTCVDRGIPIFASQVPHAREHRERGLMAEMWGRGPAPGTHVLEPELSLADNHVRVLVKRSYSAFYANDFEALLRRLGRDTIIIVGVYTSIGCHCSAVDAFMRDIRAFIVADATADMEDADHEAGLVRAARTCARVVDSSEVVRAFTHPPENAARRSGAIDVC